MNNNNLIFKMFRKVTKVVAENKKREKMKKIYSIIYKTIKVKKVIAINT